MDAEGATVMTAQTEHALLYWEFSTRKPVTQVFYDWIAATCVLVWRRPGTRYRSCVYRLHEFEMFRIACLQMLRVDHKYNSWCALVTCRKLRPAALRYSDVCLLYQVYLRSSVDDNRMCLQCWSESVFTHADASKLSGTLLPWRPRDRLHETFAGHESSERQWQYIGTQACRHGVREVHRGGGVVRVVVWALVHCTVAPSRYKWRLICA